MGDKTGIGWTDHSYNPWEGCNKVSEACTNCYIVRALRRRGLPAFEGPMLTSEHTRHLPHKWNRQAILAGVRRRVFTCSQSDFFHPGADQWRPEIWGIIRECPHLDFQILTKRPERIMECLPPDWGDGYPNVWLGVTVENDRHYDRIGILKDIPARVRFLSAEPLLGLLNLAPYLSDGSIHWVITGCETNDKGKPREMDIDWVRQIDRQCRDAGVAHYFKQYYDANGKKMEDGMLDGEVRHDFPLYPPKA